MGVFGSEIRGAGPSSDRRRGNKIREISVRAGWEEQSHEVSGDPGRAAAVLSVPGNPSPFTHSHTRPIATLSNDSGALEKPASMHAHSLMEKPRAL